ncbi:MAG: hypothetical protein Phog2KO_30700 [Phototrophicaceae bacterium]
MVRPPATYICPTSASNSNAIDYSQLQLRSSVFYRKIVKTVNTDSKRKERE